MSDEKQTLHKGKEIVKDNLKPVKFKLFDTI